MSKHHRRKSIPLNRGEVPAEVRDRILETDETYRSNLASLCSRINSGKVEPTMFNRIQPNLAMAALRRAGVNLHQSQRLLAS
jgi:hypothetical protein